MSGMAILQRRKMVGVIRTLQLSEYVEAQPIAQGSSGQSCALLLLACGCASAIAEKKENTTPPRTALIGIEPYLIFNSTPLLPAKIRTFITPTRLETRG
jgi:hypothetical protein